MISCSSCDATQKTNWKHLRTQKTSNYLPSKWIFTTHEMTTRNTLKSTRQSVKH